MFVSLVVVGIAAASFSESNATLRLSDSLSQENKVLLLSKKFQQALFADKDHSQTILKMREVFFPSAKYRYWHADNIEIIDIKVCIKFQALSEENSLKEKQELFNRTHTHDQCLRFRWTNSYFVNLVDIRQMTYFELLTTGALFGIIAHGHNDRIIEIDFNLTHNETVNSIEDTVTKRALIQFLSWVSYCMCHPHTL